LLSFENFCDVLLLANENLNKTQVNIETGNFPYAPDFDDLYFLYSTIRKDCVISILEFGSGWSTLAMSIGLLENKQLFGTDYKLKNPNPFQLMTIDASQMWMSVALGRLNDELKEIVIAIVSAPKISEYRGSMVSFFQDVAFFVPDLIYLDGPDIDQVEGDFGSFYFDKVDGLPMAGDLLRLENYLLPWTTIITDGRRANAKLLESMFRRNWQNMHDPFGDHTLFRLDENPLGPQSEKHIQFRLDHSRSFRLKIK